MKKYTQEFLDDLLKKAAESPRLRTNYNIHEDTDDPINRLYIAAVPGTEFATHRHADRWELVTCLRGSFISRIFDDNGKVIDEIQMGKEMVSIELPPGTWHTIEVLTPCVFLEVKKGPYAPVAPEDTMFPGK
jgi:cupin fold WbuC family metalloprotein